MKAAICKKYGGPEVLRIEDVPKPDPGEGEVLIKTEVVAVATEDPMNRRGEPLFTRLFTGLAKPKQPILGAEFSGYIATVGKAVSGYKEGDAVFGATGTSYGCYAEYFCMRETGFLSKKPDYLSHEEAAPVCGYMTAWNFLVDKARLKEGQRVLINGASGAVGTAAVQLANHLGAEVTGVCSGKNTELVASLGADHTIDYTSEDFRTNGKTYDVILGLAGKTTFSGCRKSLEPKGMYINAVLTPRILIDMLLTSRSRGKRAMFSATGLLPVETRLSFLNDLLPIVEQGKLRTIIDKRFRLEAVGDAHRYVEDGNKTGNVVIVMA